MTKADQYLAADVKNILDNGMWDLDPRPVYADGAPAHAKFVTHNVRSYDLSKGEFPITTLRPIPWKSAVREIFAIYQKPTNNIKEMEAMGIPWWAEWDIGDGTIGQRYGATVKRYDLTEKLLTDIKENPYGRRHIISLWQNADLEEGPGLAPCAFLTNWSVRGEFLDMVLFQRSGDYFPASGAGSNNEVQYAAFLLMVARHTGYKPGKFTHFLANEHIYDRHVESAEEMLRRFESRSEEGGGSNEPWPMLVLDPKVQNFYDITIDDFAMENYEPMKPQLKFDLGI